MSAAAKTRLLLNGNGVVMTWDLDGNVLSVRVDSYLNDPYWSK